MNREFLDHFRAPDALARFVVNDHASAAPGFFPFGDGLVCFGQSSAGTAPNPFRKPADDSLAAVRFDNGNVVLPFDPDQVASNLRNEVYTGSMERDFTRLGSYPALRAMYYWGRPFLPVRLRSILQRVYLQGETQNPFPKWPVDRSVETLFDRLMALVIQSGGGHPIPFIWFWPDGAQAALILTHDVETTKGRDFTHPLMDLDDKYGFKASFQVVPEKRYSLPADYLDSIRNRGFEVNVHDLDHDGSLFREKEEFLKRAEQINRYAEIFRCSGFRSGALYRNPRWYEAFQFSYDMSIPSVAHLDPQGGGCCTTFPYFIGNILEMPVTLSQDYSLFHILNQYSIDLWKQQFETIVGANGLVSIIIHPDYVIEQSAQNTYRDLLNFFAHQRIPRGIWATLPAEINRWWRMRRQMKLVRQGDGWRIVGEGSERARLAYARLVDGALVYSFDGSAYGRSIPSLPDPAGHRVPEASFLAAQSGMHVEAVTQDSLVDATASEPTGIARLHGRPLRIAMVAYTFYETDNRVMRYAETLAKRGDHVDVFALRLADQAAEEDLNGVLVHRLQGRLLNEKGVFSYAWRLTQFFLRALYQVSLHDLRAKYDLIHVHSVPDFLVFSTLLPRLRGTPVILDIHDILPEFYASKFGSSHSSRTFKALLAVERFSARFASHVIIANHIWKERLLSRSVTPDKCTVVLNSPDRSIFTRSAAPTRNGNRITLLYPGSLNWHQGLEIAIRAFARISDKVPNADLVIYGDGPSKDELVQLARELGLGNRVQMPASKPLREIAKTIESADIGIVPKRKDSFGNEAFSTKILEFMAMGVPVIVSDTKVDRYYFNDSVVRFFRGGDDEDLARCMLDLILNQAERKQLAQNASRFVEQIDWNAKQGEYLDLVDTLAAVGPRNG
jgi:glycosyltransferase involved in cell wall biosynthesis